MASFLRSDTTAAKSLHVGNGLGTDCPQPCLWGILWLKPGPWDAQHKGFVLRHYLITTAGHVMRLKPPGVPRAAADWLNICPRSPGAKLHIPGYSPLTKQNTEHNIDMCLGEKTKVKLKKKKKGEGEEKRDLLRSSSPTSAYKELFPRRHSFRTAEFQKSQEVALPASIPQSDRSHCQNIPAV